MICSCRDHFKYKTAGIQPFAPPQRVFYFVNLTGPFGINPGLVSGFLYVAVRVTSFLVFMLLCNCNLSHELLVLAAVGFKSLLKL